MSTSSLSGKLQAAISAAFPVEDNQILADACDAIAQAIVDEIQTNALVTGVVTSGAGAGGSVTGTVG